MYTLRCLQLHGVIDVLYCRFVILLLLLLFLYRFRCRIFLATERTLFVSSRSTPFIYYYFHRSQFYSISEHLRKPASHNIQVPMRCQSVLQTYKIIRTYICVHGCACMDIICNTDNTIRTPTELYMHLSTDGDDIVLRTNTVNI